MPDTENKVLIGELGLDVSDIINALDTLKDTFSKDFQHISVETIRFVAEIQKKFGKLDDAALEHARKLIEAGKLVKSQKSQYEALGKALGSLPTDLQSAEKMAKSIGQIYRMFAAHNKDLADAFSASAGKALEAAKATYGESKAQKKLVEEANKTNQVLREQNKLLDERASGQSTGSKSGSTQRPKAKREQSSRKSQDASLPKAEAAAGGIERLGESAKEANTHVEALVDTLSKPVASSHISTPVEEVKEHAQEAERAVISLGKEIKGIGRKKYNADELSSLDKNLELSYGGIYGGKGIEKVTRYNVDEITQQLDPAKKRFETFFADLSQMFRNSDISELGQSLSKLFKTTDFSPQSKDYRRELFAGVPRETFDSLLSQVAGGAASKESVKVFKGLIKQIIENANKMRVEVEQSFADAYAAIESYRSKADTHPHESRPTGPDNKETQRQNIAVKHLETILGLRKEIAAAGKSSAPPEEKELQLYEYLANSLLRAKRQGDASFIDEVRIKYSALFAEFEKAKGIPPLLNLIMSGAEGAQTYLNGRSIAKNGRSSQRKGKKNPELKMQSPESASVENAYALIKAMEQLHKIIGDMSGMDVGSAEFLNAEKTVEG